MQGVFFCAFLGRKESFRSLGKAPEVLKTLVFLSLFHTREAAKEDLILMPPFCPAPYIINGRKAFRKAPSLPLTEEKSFCTFERNCGCLLTYCFALNIQKKNISPQKRRFQCKKGRFASKKGKICPKKRILRKKGKL